MANFFKELGGLIFGKDMSKQNQQIGDQKQQEMMNALKMGQTEGRERAESLYGTDAAGIGGMAKDVTDRTQASTRQYSGAGDLIKQKGNQQAKVNKLRSGKSGGGTQAESAQTAQNMATATAQNRFQQQQQSMANYRSLVGNLARNMASSEMGQGALNLSAVRPLSDADMKQSKGLLSFLG